MKSTANGQAVKGIDYPVHPAASIFPMMDEASFQRLKEDIRVNGLHESVVLWRGQLIDGRNRQRALDELGIPNSPCELDDNDDPVAYVISKNLHRRQVATSQRALIAARLATLELGANQHGKEGGQNCPPSTVEAAKILGVSPSSVKSAKTVLSAKCDELVQLVETDRLSVAVAAAFAKIKMTATDRRTLCSLSDAPLAVRRAVNEDERLRNPPPRVPRVPLPPAGPPPRPVCPQCGGKQCDDVDGTHCPKCSIEMVDEPKAAPPADPVPATSPVIVSEPSAATPSWSCSHCGHDQRDDDGDCLQCREPKPAKRIAPVEPELLEGVSRGKGVMRANEALNCLMQIPKNDGLRKRAFQIVTDWISHNGGEVAEEPNHFRQLTYARIERIQEVVWELRSYVSSPADQVQLGKVFEFCAVLATLTKDCLAFRKLDAGRARRNK